MEFCIEHHFGVADRSFLLFVQSRLMWPNSWQLSHRILRDPLVVAIAAPLPASLFTCAGRKGRSMHKFLIIG